jgi:anti-sigma factor RsiW
MSHQPYETYLFSGETLSTDQQSCLDAHLMACERCNQLARAMTHLGVTFSNNPAPSPTPGFTDRFQARITAHRQEQQNRKLWLMAIGLFALAGLIISLITLLHLNQTNWAYDLTQFIARTSLLAAQTRQFLNLLKPFRSALPLFLPLMLMLMTSALAFISVLFVIWFRSIIKLYSPVQERGHLS